MQEGFSDSEFVCRASMEGEIVSVKCVAGVSRFRPCKFIMVVWKFFMSSSSLEYTEPI